MEATQRSVTPVGQWRIETRNIEIIGMVDDGGQPCVATIRRLPALEVYLLQGTAERAELREIYRRWGEQAIVAPDFSFNGTGEGVPWDSLPFATHEALARQIMEFSLEGTPAAEAAGEAFRRREPARGAVRGTGGGPRDHREDGTGEPAAPDTGGDAAGREPAPADSGTQV